MVMPFRGDVLGPAIRELPQQMGPYYETRGERFMGPSAPALALQYAPRAIAERGEMATPFSAFVGPDRASMPRINPDPRRFVPPGGWRGQTHIQAPVGDWRNPPEPIRPMRHFGPIDPIAGSAGMAESLAGRQAFPIHPSRLLPRDEFQRQMESYGVLRGQPSFTVGGYGGVGQPLASRPVVLPPVEPLPEMPGFRASLR